MKSKLSTVLFVSVLPTLLVSLLFYVLLGHRRDYLGHYAAGFGGTLCAATIVLAAIPARLFHRIGYSTVVPCTLLCIAVGAVAEATVFRLAKFDQVDFCNQNLGAVFAAFAAIHIAGDKKPTDVVLRCLIAFGAVYLVMGGYFAIT